MTATRVAGGDYWGLLEDCRLTPSRLGRGGGGGAPVSAKTLGWMDVGIGEQLNKTLPQEQRLR